MKKIISLLLLSVALVSEAESFEVGGILYDKLADTEGECYVTYAKGIDAYYSGEIEIPSEVEYEGSILTVSAIGEYAFAGCQDIKSVDIPQSIVTIGRNAFQGCINISAISLPDAVTQIPEQAFYGCESLQKVESPGVRVIGDAAFANCKTLQELEFNLEIYSIGSSAFRNCLSLQEFSLEEENLLLGEYAFSGCTSLSFVALPVSFTSIPDYAFNDCTSLKKIQGTVNVTRIGNNAFSNCSSLVSLELNAPIEFMGKHAFEMCSSLDLNRISGKDLTIDDYAFAGCESLENIELEGVSEIGKEAFSYASNLRYIRLDGSVKNINAYAFHQCENIEYIGCFAEQPPKLQETAFTKSVYSNATLEVLSGLRLLYRQTPFWSNFNKVEELPDSGVNTGIFRSPSSMIILEGSLLHISGCEGRVTVYNIEGILVADKNCMGENIEISLPGKGIYLVRINEGMTQKILVR